MRFSAKIDPSLPNLSHDIDGHRRRVSAYADAAPDLIRTVDNTTQIQPNLRRRTTQPRRVADQHDRAGRSGQRRDGHQPPGADGRHASAGTDDRSDQRVPPSADLRAERNVPAGQPAAHANPRSRGARRDQPGCRAIPLPAEPARRSPPRAVRSATGELPVPFNTFPPFDVADVGANPWKYGNPGNLRNSDAPQTTAVRTHRRTAAQHRTDRAARMSRVAAEPASNSASSPP